MTTDAIARTTRWLERAVIGLNLCPFAKAVHVKGQIRYVVSDATTTETLRRDLQSELSKLVETPAEQIDTTLLIHPRVLSKFADYNDFLADADELLEDMDLDGILQIASFHPDYRFADSARNDPANFSNRSPYPMLHLLREDSVSRAVETVSDPTKIYERNIETLRGLSRADLAQLVGDEEA